MPGASTSSWPRSRRSSARRSTRRSQRDRAAAGLRPPGSYRRASAEAAGPQLGRRDCRTGRMTATRCGRWPRSRAARRRRHPPHGLAEPDDLRRPDAEVAAVTSAIEAIGLGPAPRRSGPGSWPARATAAASSPTRTRSATPRDRGLHRAARRAGPAGQHPPDGLPQLLRPALHRRHRADRRQGAGRRGGHGRGLCHPRRRRLRHRGFDRAS